MNESKIIHALKREIIEASPEHESNFRAAFELLPDAANDPQCIDAFEYAATHKLYPDEMAYIGAITRRKEPADALTSHRYKDELKRDELKRRQIAIQELEMTLAVIKGQLDEMQFILRETRQYKIETPLEWVSRRDAALKKYDNLKPAYLP